MESETLVFGMVIGVLIMVIIGNIIGFDEGNTEALAQSICDQEYGMDYKSYDNKVLECQPKTIVSEEPYDGIRVRIGGG